MNPVALVHREDPIKGASTMDAIKSAFRRAAPKKGGAPKEPLQTQSKLPHHRQPSHPDMNTIVAPLESRVPLKGAFI